MGKTLKTSAQGKYLPDHGDAGKTRLYNIWKKMRQRCRVMSERYKNYSGRGITVCQEWDSFPVFRAWAYLNGYSDSLQIDRINNDGNYEPSNCRWASPRTQLLNRAMTRSFTIWDETKTMCEWSEDHRCVVTYNCFHLRLGYGWDPAKALTTPSDRGQSRRKAA